jgi:hypothetical protein
LTAGYVAGPAQTKLTVQRENLNVDFAESAIKEEAVDLATMLKNRSGEASPSAVEGLIRGHLPSLEAYLSQSDVQEAVQAIADAIETAGSSRVDWNLLEDLVSWDKLPPLPSLE